MVAGSLTFCFFWNGWGSFFSYALISGGVASGLGICVAATISDKCRKLENWRSDVGSEGRHSFIPLFRNSFAPPPCLLSPPSIAFFYRCIEIINALNKAVQ